jgi:hypothetical protein
MIEIFAAIKGRTAIEESQHGHQPTARAAVKCDARTATAKAGAPSSSELRSLPLHK